MQGGQQGAAQGQGQQNPPQQNPPPPPPPASPRQGQPGQGGQGQPNPPAPVPPQQQQQFHHSPWQMPIDVTSKVGKALWDEGVKPLSEEQRFSGLAKDVSQFLASVAKQARKCFWMDILTFGNLNLLKHWGSITAEQVTQARNARNQ